MAIFFIIIEIIFLIKQERTDYDSCIYYLGQVICRHFILVFYFCYRPVISTSADYYERSTFFRKLSYVHENYCPDDCK